MRCAACCLPVLTDSDFFQFGAFVEHIAHICDVSCIQRAEVKLGQAAALGKHCTHPCHRRSVQIGKINCFKSCPVLEHSLCAVGQLCNCLGLAILHELHAGDFVPCIGDKIVIRKRRFPVGIIKFAAINRQNIACNIMRYASG